MSVTIEMTDAFVSVDGVSCRLWRGETSTGARVAVFVHRMHLVMGTDDELVRGLVERPAPRHLASRRIHLATRMCDGYGPMCEQCVDEYLVDEYAPELREEALDHDFAPLFRLGAFCLCCHERQGLIADAMTVPAVGVGQ